MKLSKKQIRKLTLLREQQGLAPTIVWLLRKNLYRYLALIVLCVLSLSYYYWFGFTNTAIFFSGFFIAVFMREFQLLRRHVIDWQLIKDTTNWTRVSELLSSNSSRVL